MHGPRQRSETEWKFGPRQRVEELPVGGIVRHCNMFRMHSDQKRDAIIYDNTAQDRVVYLPVAVTVRPCCSQCTVTKRDMQLSMTIWPQIKNCSCECKALLLFRMQWPKETGMTVWPETVVELPVTVRPCCCSECNDQKRQVWQYGPRQL